MFWRRGWFLNSLKYQIVKQLHDWQKSNDILRKNKWSIIERFILFSSRRPVIFSMSILTVLTMIAYGVTYFYHDILTIIPSFSRHIWIHMDEWDFTITASSLAVIALIVPLSLGFVGNDIRASSSRDVFWKVYLEYAAPKLLVALSIFLVLFSLSSQLIEPFIEPKLRISLSSVGILWMLINTSLMGWFFFATFRLVTGDRRNRITNRYCINEELVCELEYRLSRLLPQVAVTYKFLPAISSDKEGSGFIDITTSNFYTSDHESLSIEHNEKRYIDNIYYRVLNLAIYSLYIRMFISDMIFYIFKVGNKDIVKRKLSLPLTGSDFPSKTKVLAEYSGFKFTWLERFLIKSAYRTKQGEGKRESEFKLLLSMLTGQIRDSIRDESYQKYEYAIDALEKLVKELIEGSHFINDEGKPDNWLLVADGGGFADKLFWVIDSEIYELTSESLQLLHKSTKYYERIIRTPRRIFGSKEYSLAEDITNELLKMHYHQWLALTKWKSKFMPSADNGVFTDNYSAVLRGFVSTWESWPSVYQRIDGIKWEDSKVVANFYAMHLDYTACLLIGSLRNKDIISATWAADMLIRWIDNAYLGRVPSMFQWRSDFLTLDEMGKDEDDAILSFVLKGESLTSDEEYSAHDPFTDAIKIALYNYWSDVILCASSYILQRPEDDISEQAIQLVIALIDERRPYPTGSVEGSHLSLNRGAKFIATLFRQRWLKYDSESDYGSRLNRLVSKFNSLDEAPMVSGRVYSGWGGRDIENLSKGLKSIFFYKVPGQCEIDRDLTDFISALTTYEHRASIQTRIEGLVELDVTETAKKLGIDDVGDRANSFSISFNTISTNIGEQREEELGQAEVDPDREAELSMYASRDAFDLGSSSFPVNQFANIVESDITELEKFTFAYTNYNKSNVAIGDFIRTSNEGDWLARTIDNLVSTNVMRQFWLGIKENKCEQYEDWLSILRKLKAKKNDNNNHNILIVSQWGLQWYFDKLIWGYDDIPHSEFECRREDGMPDSYLCHFHEIEVHTGPFRDIPNILTSKESFISLRVGRNETGERVQVRYMEDPESDDINIGKLELTYWISPELNNEGVLLFMGPNDENE